VPPASNLEPSYINFGYKIMVGYKICTKITASSFIMSENVAKKSVNMRGENNTVNCKTSLPTYLSEDLLLYPYI
jgi:hypothetical protein